MPFEMLAAALLLALAATPTAGQKAVVVTPRESQELFANPGMGWQTFHTVASEDKALDGLPSSCAYYRWYWREIEPEDGKIDFAKIDSVIRQARQAGQRLAFRVMCTGSGEYMDVPQWLKDEGAKGVEFTYEGRKHWVPNWEDPIFFQRHLRLIQALGRRYDRRGAIDLLDIGSVGLWGEWHMSGTVDDATGKPVPMPKTETEIAIIDAWRNAFPQTPKVMLIGGGEALKYAVDHGCGWRADCLGDMGGFSKTWSHMRDFYPQAIEKAGAQDTWKTAPVAFETCWDMRKWKEEGWDIRAIFDYALQVHVSYINNKSAPIPEGTLPEVERVLRKLGYRLVLRRLEHPASLKAGDRLPVKMEWQNVGVAPPYRDATIAVRLTPEGVAGAYGSVYGNTASIQGWLPGKKSVELTYQTESDLRPGVYVLSIGVMEPGSRRPGIRVAIDGRDPDGWYPVSRITVQ